MRNKVANQESDTLKLEFEMIKKALIENNLRPKETAAQLNISERTLYRKQTQFDFLRKDLQEILSMNFENLNLS